MSHLRVRPVVAELNLYVHDDTEALRTLGFAFNDAAEAIIFATSLLESAMNGESEIEMPVFVELDNIELLKASVCDELLNRHLYPPPQS
jgi:hypothetical protein